MGRQSLFVDFHFNSRVRSRLLLSRQAGLLLGFADEAHCSVERAVVAVGWIVCDAEADCLNSATQLRRFLLRRTLVLALFLEAESLYFV